MKILLSYTLLLFAICFTSTKIAHADQLMAGAAKVDITNRDVPRVNDTCMHGR